MELTHPTFFQIILVVFLVSWTVATLCSITTVMVIVSHWRAQCRSVNNLLACNSCVAILFYVISASLQIPSFIQNIYAHGPKINDLVCQIHGGLITFGALLVAFSFNIQAISRFCITILSRYRFLTTLRLNWILIIASWSIAGLIAVILRISPESYQYEPEAHICALTMHHFATSFTLGGIVIVSIMSTMIILYGIIIYNSFHRTATTLDRARTFRIQRSLKVFRRIFIYVAIFGFGGLPYVVCTILTYFNSAPWPLYILSYLCISLACTLDSLAILFTNDQVKDILSKKLIDRLKRKLQTIRTMQQNRVVPLDNQPVAIQQLPAIS